MLRFSANLSMLFGEYDFLARFEKAAQCGFRGVEFMFPYDYDIEELKQVLASNKLEHTLHRAETYRHELLSPAGQSHPVGAFRRWLQAGEVWRAGR